MENQLKMEQTKSMQVAIVASDGVDESSHWRRKDYKPPSFPIKQM
jgi:hypothetical protein